MPGRPTAGRLRRVGAGRRSEVVSRIGPLGLESMEAGLLPRDRLTERIAPRLPYRRRNLRTRRHRGPVLKRARRPTLLGRLDPRPVARRSRDSNDPDGPDISPVGDERWTVREEAVPLWPSIRPRPTHLWVLGKSGEGLVDALVHPVRAQTLPVRIRAPRPRDPSSSRSRRSRPPTRQTGTRSPSTRRGNLR